MDIILVIRTMNGYSSRMEKNVPDHGSAVIVGCDNASCIDRSMRKLRAMITTLYMSTQIFTC